MKLALVIVLTVVTALAVAAQAPQRAQQPPTDLEVAAFFAPDFYQGLGEAPRFDYITKFDFDGDWRGDNNWTNADNKTFALTPFIYYAVTETTTHYFIHYAVFHPRDYKGGSQRGALLSELLRQGQIAGIKYDPTGLLKEAALAHENDMEGCLLVVAKHGPKLQDTELAYLETLSHNRFLKYKLKDAERDAAPARLSGSHIQLYIEPKGHGIDLYGNDLKQRPAAGTITYEQGDRAQDPERTVGRVLAYELLSIESELMSRAKKGVNETYGTAFGYPQVKLKLAPGTAGPATATLDPGTIGSSFLGATGMPNAARPPWGWYDFTEGEQTMGQWYFDPAGTIARHFGISESESFSLTYLRPSAPLGVLPIAK